VSARRLSTRDYKDTHRASIDLRRWREFGIGLIAGLCVAAVVYVADHRAAAVPESERPTPSKAPAPDDAAAETTPDSKFDFYQMLPKFEVVVPEKEQGTRLPPAAQIDRPGVYFLQAGSYRNFDDADRVRAQLVKQGIDASVQRVAVDTDVWHRVRIGPIRDLGVLNHLRQQLQKADVDSLVIRVDD